MERKEEGNSAPCPLFATTHCPNIKRGCQFHHNTPICPQGRACQTRRTCQRRHPANCQLFLKGWCGFLDEEGVPKRYKNCSYFHPLDIKQVPPSSVMLITASSATSTVTGKNNQNITEDTQEAPKRNNKLGLSCAKLRAQKRKTKYTQIQNLWLRKTQLYSLPLKS